MQWQGLWFKLKALKTIKHWIPIVSLGNKKDKHNKAEIVVNFASSMCDIPRYMEDLVGYQGFMLQQIVRIGLCFLKIDSIGIPI
jgi:hypothetical protein